ncbi:MAG: hypothetical protein COA82_08540 [Alkaliphilus sp.]|nr:DUF302 domain-containing protein [bacterium AH-315-L21]PHS33401.1 MAG: hypothetical protein COA82_08540 [Alkaliphilus sp.]
MELSKNVIIMGLVGILVGLVIMGAIMFFTMPSMMLLEDQSNYDFETSVEKFGEAVKDNGWKVVVIHDMKETLAGFGHDVMEVKIFELCSSRHSVRILELDDERIVSALMPCRVAIYKKSNGNTYVSRMNSKLMAIPMGGVIADVMGLASSETEVILESIIGK